MVLYSESVGLRFFFNTYNIIAIFVFNLNSNRLLFVLIHSWKYLFWLCVFPGVISLSRALHGKANSVITMVISAQDGGGLTALDNARVNISIVAGLVAPPVFEQAQYFFVVSEDALRGTQVGIVRASTKNGG